MAKSMIQIKDHKQLDLFDPWRFLSPKRRQLFDKTPEMFQNEILPNLPVSAVIPLFFKTEFGRPAKELHTVIISRKNRIPQDIYD